MNQQSSYKSYSEKQFDAFFNVIKAVAVCFVFALIGFRSDAVYANPTGGSVVSGSATIGGAGSTLTVNQATDKAIINWQSFSIGLGQTTKFLQPSVTSAVLNRVVGGNLSSIYGTLRANGQVYLINPHGIVIGSTGVINAGSFTASTLNVSNSQFLAGGNLNFLGDSHAKIEQKGTINALNGGVFLIAREVINEGNINAKEVGLAGGSKVCLFKQAGENGRLFVQPDSKEGRVVNEGTISAVTAELKAMGGNVYALAINNKGIIRATGAVSENGRVILRAKNGKVANSGVIAAKNGDDTGGEVQILGEEVTLKFGSLIDVSGKNGGGKVLIGGDEGGANPNILNSQKTTMEFGSFILADSLNGNGGNVVVWSDGDTKMHGSISARAWGHEGDGGNVEVSGKENLWVTGLVDLRSANGAYGTLTLDPGAVTIKDGGNINTGFNTFNDAYIENQLNLGNLTIRTSNASHGPQDIIVLGGVWIYWAKPTCLSLIAGRSIDIQSGATIYNNYNADFTVMDFQANTAGTTHGNFSGIKMSGLLVSGSGDIKLTGHGGDRGGNNNGIEINNGNIILSYNSGSIKLNGVGGQGDKDGNRGIVVNNSSLICYGEKMVLNGTGGSSRYGENYGIEFTNNANFRLDRCPIIINGQGGNGGNHNVGIYFHNNSWGFASMQDAQIILKGWGGSGHGKNHGVEIANNSAISSYSGNIHITGWGGNGGAHNDGIYIHDNSSVYSAFSASGNVTLKGWGGSSNVETATFDEGCRGYERGDRSGNNYGVEIANSSTVSSEGKGNVAIKGWGGNGGAHNVGVYIHNNSSVNSNRGDISIKGFGGFSSNVTYVEISDMESSIVPVDSEIGNNHGVEIAYDSKVYSPQNSNIHIAGFGGQGGSHNVGVYLHNRASVKSIDGNIGIIGFGGSEFSKKGYFGSAFGSEGNNHGVEIENNSEVYGNITICGFGGIGGPHNDGIYVHDTSYVMGHTYSDINLFGRGGSSADKGFQSFIIENIFELGLDGLLGLLETLAETGNNNGVEIADNSLVVSWYRDINITGIGGTWGSYNRGVYLHDNSKIQSLGASDIYGFGFNHMPVDPNRVYGSGNIKINGFGGDSGFKNILISLLDIIGENFLKSGSEKNFDKVAFNSESTNEGLGLFDSLFAFGHHSGVEIDHHSIVETNGGDINIYGRGGYNGSYNRGVYIHDLFSGVYTSGEGNIHIKGQGGLSLLGINHVGIEVSDSSYVNAYGSGDVCLDGRGGFSLLGGNHHGVQISDYSNVTSYPGGGDVRIFGQGGFGLFGNNNGVYLTNYGYVYTTGTGDILIKGIEGIGGQGIYTQGGFNYIGNYYLTPDQSTSGDVRLIADTMELQDVAITGHGNLYIEPIHKCTSIGLGDGALGMLQLSNTELKNISDGFDHIYFGRKRGGHTITLENSGNPLNFLDDVTFRGRNINVFDPVNASSNDVTFLIGQACGGGTLMLFAPVTAGLSQAFGGWFNDRFVFGDGMSLNGIVDGGHGSDTLNFSRYTTNLVIDLINGTATGTGGIKHIENVICGTGDDIVYTQLFPWRQFLLGGPHTNGDTLIVNFMGLTTDFPDSPISFPGFGKITYAQFEFLNPPDIEIPDYREFLGSSYDEDDRFDILRNGEKGKKQNRFNVLYSYDSTAPLQGPVHNSSFRVFAGDPSAYAVELLSNYFPY